MKKITTISTVMLPALAAPLFTQTTVNMYGLISTRMFYTSNEVRLKNEIVSAEADTSVY